VILVAGEALYDLVVGDDALRAHPGGGPFNTARTVARLGRPVAFLSRLSTDRFGATLERMLADDGVARDALVRTDEPTTLALAEVGPGGDARYHFYDQGTSAPGLTAQAALAALPPAVDILHVGTLGLVFEPMAQAVEAVVERLAGTALVAVDPNCRPAAIGDAAAYRARLERVLARADLVKVSEEDLAWLQATPSELLERGPAVVLVTRGRAGATVVTRTDEVAVAPRPADVVDTIGAGDAFGGGVIAWWHERRLGREELSGLDNLVEAAQFGSVVASLTCERPGASPPYRDEVV
jgi:fructokinase